MKISGIENLSGAELAFEIQQGARFVLFQYCVSLLVITFKRPTEIYFVRANHSAVLKGLPWTLLSVVAGWWGIPWGPIYTIQSIYKNSRGGVDVTDQVISALGQSRPKTAAATASGK